MGLRTREIILSRIGDNVSPIRLLTVLAIISLVVSTSPPANAREADIPFRSIVPNGWTLLPPEPQSQGRRFVSPTGDAWLWFFAVPAHREAVVNTKAERLEPPPTERSQPTSVGVAIGLSVPGIEATEYFTEGRC